MYSRPFLLSQCRHQLLKSTLNQLRGYFSFRNIRRYFCQQDFRSKEKQFPVDHQARLQQGQQALRAKVQQFEQQLRGEERRFTEEIFRELKGAIRTVSIRDKYDLVLEKNAAQVILYMKQETTDFTQKVIDHYNSLKASE